MAAYSCSDGDEHFLSVRISTGWVWQAPTTSHLSRDHLLCCPLLPSLTMSHVAKTKQESLSGHCTVWISKSPVINWCLRSWLQTSPRWDEIEVSPDVSQSQKCGKIHFDLGSTSVSLQTHSQIHPLACCAKVLKEHILKWRGEWQNLTVCVLLDSISAQHRPVSTEIIPLHSPGSSSSSCMTLTPLFGMKQISQHLFKSLTFQL